MINYTEHRIPKNVYTWKQTNTSNYKYIWVKITFTYFFVAFYFLKHLQKLFLSDQYLPF